ncbi:hypothetical protein MACJ_003713 [Theileria orientalis]|uniref:Uncharacterized protein n=1 Tax=Theileria orientalis TaxID=68886 RepID=A0A976XK70_THEOR|nr:hypothetical protein MACJ_003713 [Theileria orientalis]
MLFAKRLGFKEFLSNGAFLFNDDGIKHYIPEKIAS